MCGRLNVTEDPLTQLLMEAFGISATPATNQNLAPTENVLAVRATAAADYVADDMRWWLTPSWSSKPSTKYAMFNAKSETLAEKRAFSRPFRSQRCVVPVTGYYEWKKSASEKLPFHIHAKSHTGLLLAGLWDSWTDKATGEVLESCSIVTAAAHESLAFLHHRQPVFLSPGQAAAWLAGDATPEQLGVLFEPHLPGELIVDPVSSYVNNARNKSERCVQPIAQGYVVDGQVENFLAAEPQDLFDHE